MYEILPKRTMSLGGQRVEAGKPAKVSKDDHDLAVRMGWATSVDKTKKAEKTE